MVVLKKGDWVLCNDGRIGQITVTDFTAGYHLVNFKDNTFARNIHQHYLTKIDPAFHNLLTDVHKESNDE